MHDLKLLTVSVMLDPRTNLVNISGKKRLNFLQLGGLLGGQSGTLAEWLLGGLFGGLLDGLLGGLLGGLLSGLLSRLLGFGRAEWHSGRVVVWRAVGRADGRAVGGAELHSGCWAGCCADRVTELQNGRVVDSRLD